VATLHDYAGTMLTPEDFIPVRRVDVEIEPSEVTRQSVLDMSRLEPFGFGNPTPQFVARGVEALQIMPTKNPAHSRATLRKGTGSAISAMGFGLGERMSTLSPGTKLDVLFDACIDRYNGSETLKWHLRDYVEV
jgi:single-stranded-DNA-specific exonuclease